MKRLSCLYVWWFAYKCEENLCKNRVLVRKFLSLCAAWSNGFENLINVNFFRRKIYSLPERHASFKLATPEKMLLLTGKFRKYDEIPAIFFNLGAWRAAKTRVCLLRFSALKLKAVGRAQPQAQAFLFRVLWKKRETTRDRIR